MKLSFNISLAEMADILRKSLAEMHSCEVEEVRISSYGKPRIIIQEDGMVDTCGPAVRHDSKTAPL